MKTERLEMIKKMLEQNPSDAFLKYAAALEYKKFNNREQAIVLLKELSREHPDYLATYYQLGKILEESGNIPEAISFYKNGKLIALKQNDRKALSEINEALVMLDAEDDI